MNTMLEFVVWDVQHGNAIYMKTPNGKHVMFDIGTGSYANGAEFSPLHHLKHNWKVNCLHYLVISHPHADHISDIRNMFHLNLKPLLLYRPRNIDPDLISTSNQATYSDLVELYLELDRGYVQSVSADLDPSNPANYGEVRMRWFYQCEHGTRNLNNYSIIAVLEYGGEKIIIPGDIETVGWKVLLEQRDFQDAIKGTTVFVASHHGREVGFHSDVFKYFKPDIVIVSDGKYSDNSVTNGYGNHAQGFMVKSRNTGALNWRYVLTTRNDAAICVTVSDSGKQITIK